MVVIIYERHWPIVLSNESKINSCSADRDTEHMICTQSQMTHNSPLTNSPSIGRQRLSSGSVSIAHNQNVINAIRPRPEGILENPTRSQDNLAIVSGSLSGRRSVKVPTGEVLHGGSTLNGESAGFGAGVSIGVDPNIFCQNFFCGVGEGVEAVDDCGI